jgi:hypothetical protein
LTSVIAATAGVSISRRVEWCKQMRDDPEHIIPADAAMTKE